MANPFEVLGLHPWANPDEIRTAYRLLVKKNHPDLFPDPERKSQAQQKMIRLNLAYEEALKLALPRQKAAYIQQLPQQQAVILAERMLKHGQPGAALHQLERSSTKDAAWYDMHGRIMMQLEQYEKAHASFREAVRLCPENNLYHSGALDAAIAMKREKTLTGRARRFWRKILKPRP